MIPFIKLPLISLNLRQTESTWRENFLCRDAWKIINCPVLVIYWVFKGLKLPFSKEQNSKEIFCCNEIKYGKIYNRIKYFIYNISHRNFGSKEMCYKCC